VEKNTIICGNINKIPSVFIEQNQTEDFDLDEKKKIRVHPKYLLPLHVFLENSSFDRIYDKDVINRVLRAFNVDLNDKTNLD